MQQNRAYVSPEASNTFEYVIYPRYNQICQKNKLHYRSYLTVCLGIIHGQR